MPTNREIVRGSEEIGSDFQTVETALLTPTDDGAIATHDDARTGSLPAGLIGWRTWKYRGGITACAGLRILANVRFAPKPFSRSAHKAGAAESG
jgi:hypothetical protein